MNPYEPPTQSDTPTTIESPSDQGQLSEQSRVLVAWSAASLTTTFLLAAAFLMVSGLVARFVALTAIAFVGCLVPYVVLRLLK